MTHDLKIPRRHLFEIYIIYITLFYCIYLVQWDFCNTLVRSDVDYIGQNINYSQVLHMGLITRPTVNFFQNKKSKLHCIVT